MAMHVRYNSCYIFLLSSAKQRELTKFWLSGERYRRRLIFDISIYRCVADSVLTE